MRQVLCKGSRRSTRVGRRRFASRSGLTLYEVLISLAIFLPALAVLGQAVSHGGRAAVQAQLQTEAILRCDSVMDEVVAGIQPLTPSSGNLFPDGAPNWTWSLEVLEGPLPGLLEIQVIVSHTDSKEQVNSSSIRTRLMRDPLTLADIAAQQSQTQPTDTSTTTAQ